ncbi:MAG: hypothetical protein M3R36_12360 [Bacteroidota bacterium]|nr:hypothetical protein [Bacteroidota bacterium]
MGNPKTYHFKLTSANRPADVVIPELWYPGIKPFIKGSSSQRIFDPIFGIKAVVIHATAGGSSEGAVSVIKSGKASFHWLVPDEDEVAHERNNMGMYSGVKSSISCSSSGFKSQH